MPTIATVVATLLKRADEYERKAAALRISAADLNGQATETKREEVGTTLKKAATLRKTQAAEATETKSSDTEQQALVRGFLAEAPHSTREIQAYLASQGINISHHTVLAWCHKMQGVKHTGATQSARWRLAGHKYPAAADRT